MTIIVTIFGPKQINEMVSFLLGVTGHRLRTDPRDRSIGPVLGLLPNGHQFDSPEGH